MDTFIHTYIMGLSTYSGSIRERLHCDVMIGKNRGTVCKSCQPSWHLDDVDWPCHRLLIVRPSIMPERFRLVVATYPISEWRRRQNPCLPLNVSRVVQLIQLGYFVIPFNCSVDTPEIDYHSYSTPTLLSTVWIALDKRPGSRERPKIKDINNLHCFNIFILNNNIQLHKDASNPR